MASPARARVSRAGNAAAVKGVGTGRVLNSKSGDRVFLNFVDHGAAGLIAMPVGDYWYAPDFQATLAFLNTNKMYSELVFYLEACEAGSMFDGLLPAGVKVYATTAANPGAGAVWGVCVPACWWWWWWWWCVCVNYVGVVGWVRACGGLYASYGPPACASVLLCWRCVWVFVCVCVCVFVCAPR